MPRIVRDAALENRSGRSRLKVAQEPYFRLIEPGLFLGYRKLSSGPGKWITRRYRGDGSYAKENLRTADGALIIADDFAEADGVSVLTFAQAQAAARMKPGQSSGPYTVANACADYLNRLRSDGRSDRAIRDAQYRIDRIIEDLGKVKTSALTSDRLKNWRNSLVGVVKNDDERRAKRATANRTWTTLRAALNLAFENRKIENDLAWRSVKPFKGVDVARVRYLTVEECQRLINACDQDFRSLVMAALQTGCRYGELTRLTVNDYNPDANTLTIGQSKSGKSRHVVLTEEGVELFRQVCAGRAGSDLILRRDDGEPFGKSHQIRPMNEACDRAHIKPHISFHILRHTWASLAAMNGMPLMVVAKNLGHADTRMVEKHYGHLAPSYVAEAIRAGAPRFGTAPSSSVVPIRR